ncbi:hypothetical protein MMC31_004535 [Peltigera leucophlebia]|nr:hypothetical protein [Peltigera leucophlebia]
MESNSRSITEEVAADIRRAINALPPAHQVEPQDGELVDNPRNGYIQLQDWAFVQGFALVKESSRSDRWILHCIHHQDQIRDYLKIYET